MSFDKAKTMRSAERYLAQGKIASAISEYEQIVERDSRDFNTLNMLGDLHIKNSSEDKAIVYYIKVAEHYDKQGFAKKAIAIFNKVLRIKPDSVEVMSKLAHLYHIGGSVAESRSLYKDLAKIYESKGQKTEALAIWEKTADMDTSDSGTFIKIAESYFNENQFEDAAKAYNQAATRAALLEDYESAITAFSKTLEINPEDRIALNGLVKSQIELGYSDEAAKKLEESLEKQPNNKEIIHLLVDCYMDMNDPLKAEKIIIKLLEKEPASYPKLLELIKIYLKADDTDSATRILSITTENLLAAGQDEQLITELNEILAKNPEQLDALRLLIRYHSWKRESAEVKQTLERLAEAAQHLDSLDDEKFALVQLLMIEPQNEKFGERLQEIKAVTGDFSETVLPIEEFSGNPDTPIFENFAADEDDDAIHTSEINSFENFESFYAEEKDYSAYEAAENAANGNGYHVEASVIENFEPQQDQHSNLGEDTEFAEHIYENEESDSGELSPASELRLEQEIESLEFYISQKYHDLADKSLIFLQEDFGNRPEFADLRRRIDAIAPVKEQSETENQSKDESEQETETVSAVEEIVEPNVYPTEEIVEISAENTENSTVIENIATVEPQEALTPASFTDFNDFQNELGFGQTEEPNSADQYETHFHTATAYQEMGLMEVAIREFQDAINLVEVNDGTRRFFKCANLLGHCFGESGMANLALIWYQRALETVNLDDSEKLALNYEIGKVYESCGEEEKALEKFEQIYAVDVDYRDISEHLERLREKLAVPA